jgi:hypothetical protein
VTEREPARPAPTDDEPPPILGSWQRLYALVLAWLLVVIIALWIVTRAYA